MLFDPLDPVTHRDPYPAYRAVRESERIYWHPTFRAWFLTHYADLLSVYKRPAQFQNAPRVDALFRDIPTEKRESFRELRSAFTLLPLFTDPPRHTRIRALFIRAFVPRVIEPLRSEVEQLTRRFLNDVHDRGTFDVIQDFAFPLPMLILARLMGVPEADRDRLRDWTSGVLQWFTSPIRPEGLTEIAQRSMLEMKDYFRVLVKSRGKKPGQDFISYLSAPDEGGDALTDDEVLVGLVQLLLAGHDTTTSLIGNGVLRLLQNPDQLRRLREEPELIETAVEESLRYDPPVQIASRTAGEDVSMEGVTIRKGDFVLLCIAAANRDPARFPDPEIFDIGRSDNPHLAFGHRTHFCLGAPLARMQAQLAVLELIRRFPRLALGVKVEELDWRKDVLFRGLNRLPVRF